MTVALARRSRAAWGAAGVLWALAVVLLVVAGWRLTSATGSHFHTAPPLPVEDRRAYRFRDLTYTQTVGMLRTWLMQAYRASNARRRSLALARVASMQRERGLMAEANAAAEEARRLAGDDPQVRAILERPLSPEDLSPVP